MSRIVLTELPGWADLSDGERYHAGVLARQLEGTGTVSEWHPKGANQVLYTYNDEFERARHFCWIRLV